MLQHALALLLLASPLASPSQDLVCRSAARTGVERQGHRRSTLRVLFLGNSHTYVNQVPCLVQRLALSLEPGVHLEVVAVARDGATLEQHWGDPATRALVQAGPWDVLVLQEQGRRPIEQPGRTSAAVRRFGGAARELGARLVLYVPPIGRARPADLPRIDAVYGRIAAEAGGTLAPVAQAWDAVGRADSSVRLHDADGVHATPVGSYLTACVLLAVITGRSPATVAPLTLRRPYGSAASAPAIPDTLAGTQATALQAAAWRAVRKSRSGGAGS